MVSWIANPTELQTKLVDRLTAPATPGRGGRSYSPTTPEHLFFIDACEPSTPYTVEYYANQPIPWKQYNTVGIQFFSGEHVRCFCLSKNLKILLILTKRSTLNKIFYINN